MQLEKKRLLIKDVIALVALLVLDQVTKYLSVLHLKNQDAIVLIPGWLELHYLENQGAAFGMLQNQKIFFVIIASLILALIVYVLYKIPYSKRYTMLHVLLTLIAAGAIGNMIDRIRQDYVVDFIYFVIINFPIFNVADIYVSVATTLLVIVILFHYKEEDFYFLSFSANKIREAK
ncbi:MAG: signal peptidase II [Lachnospiraceae bacterium]|nr:signal peptidase II [Lachnospiraceae bacterium]